MESFSDGVFGFAATPLVVYVALHPSGTPLQQVLHAWPAYLAYIISFLTIGGAWLLHTALTDRLAQTAGLLLRRQRRSGPRTGLGRKRFTGLLIRLGRKGGTRF
jgi:uncharacterized membrane protein